MRRLFFIGDLHRNFQWLENTLGDYKNSDVILLGDVEFQFENDAWLKWFDQKYTFSNIHLVKDYTILNLKYKILCVGGATSIDRKLKASKYFKEEEFVYDEDFCNKVKDIDIVVTHSAPEFSYPRGFDNKFLQTYYDIDTELRSDLIAERVTLSRMFDVLSHSNTIKMWAYGHFHQSKTENIFGTIFKLLQICEVYELE